MKFGEDWKDVKSQYLSPFKRYIGVNAEKQIFREERVGDRESCNASHVLKNIYLKMNERL